MLVYQRVMGWFVAANSANSANTSDLGFGCFI